MLERGGGAVKQAGHGLAAKGIGGAAGAEAVGQPGQIHALLDAVGKAVEIGFREFDVLSYFARNPRRFISRDELLNKVWNLPTPSVSHVVEVCINGLRKKLLDRDKQIIQSVRGLGYSLGKPEE